MLRARHRGAAVWSVICMNAGLLAAPALGQAEVPAFLPRVSGPRVEAVALEGDRVGSGRIRFIGPAHVDRQGDIAFEAQLDQLGQQRWGLFAWSRGAVTTLALEGQETGRGPLLLIDPLLAFREWIWGDGGRALFVAAVDANRNGVFDAGVDPQLLFLAEPGRLTPLLRTGDPLDGGKLLSILSFRVNGRGQVAFQAVIDRNGDGQFTPGIDTAGIYLLENGQARPLVRDGDRVGGGIVSNLELNLSELWQLNDRGEVLLEAVGLEGPGPLYGGGLAVALADRTGIRLLAGPGLQTPFGTFYSAPESSLNNNGDVIFSASVLSPTAVEGVLFRLFRLRSGAPASRLEVLAQPGVLGPDGSPIGDTVGYPPSAIADDGSVAFCAVYPQPISFIEGQFEYPTACFVRTPSFLYEVTRVGDPTPWGTLGDIGKMVLNDRTQLAVEVRAAMYPFDPKYGPGIGPEAILFWENGAPIGVVGPGDLIPGGQVDITTRLVGLSNNGRLAFETRVMDDRGISRDGIFVALVSGER
jgi:hypothetical protein